MKLNRIIFPAVACALIAGSCDDNKMEWGMPDDHNSATLADIPLDLQEKLANYKAIKEYAALYTPDMTIGLGLGAEMYLGDENYKALADENFQMFTTGNAMKHSSVVSNSGSLNFSTIDAFLAAVPSDIQVYGHNFIWHTQQRQAYLKTLIAPEMVVVSDPSSSIENIVDNSDFEAGHTNGWGAWSSNGCTQSISDQGEGCESDYAIKLYNPVAGANYSAQAYYTLPTMAWSVGDIYVLSFKVKADHVDSDFQMELQNRNSYSAVNEAYMHFPVNSANTWFTFEKEIEITQGIIDNGPTHITVDFGAGEGYVWLDDVMFGKKKEGPYNYCTNGDFSKGTEGWTLNSGNDQTEVVDGVGNPSGNAKMLKLVAPESAANAWDLEIVSPAMPTLPGKKVNMSFYVKSDQAGKMRCAFNGLKNNYPWMPWTDPSGSWSEGFETSTTWTYISLDIFNYNDNGFAEDASEWSIKFDMGYLPGVTYYLDDVRITEIDESGTSSLAAVPARITRAGGVSYKLKSAEEKKTALLGAMEEWIKGMLTHPGMERIKAWDVINEPIADGSNQWRGIDGTFGSTDSDGNPDMAPTEDTESGLSLNWASDHFYWGYYIGKEYATKAFEYARTYAPADAKLFVNDYNLETAPNKLAALIEFVKYIDENNVTGQPIVDGIGTQMHVSTSITREQVDAMFSTMAATGKLVRVTELDVQLGTGSPSAEQLEKQSDTYRMIIDSYKANVPAAQQSGITIWSLSDNAAEHEYWLSGDAPNLFDANYARKHAYKGVCDGIAGKDISEEFTGEDWKSAYSNTGGGGSAE